MLFSLLCFVIVVFTASVYHILLVWIIRSIKTVRIPLFNKQAKALSFGPFDAEDIDTHVRTRTCKHTRTHTCTHTDIHTLTSLSVTLPKNVSIAIA